MALVLMADTGIVEILSVAFGGVLKMLSGKKFPQNVRALRMLVEELVWPLFGKNSFHNMDDLLQELDAISVKSSIGAGIMDALTSSETHQSSDSRSVEKKHIMTRTTISLSIVRTLCCMVACARSRDRALLGNESCYMVGELIHHMVCWKEHFHIWY